MSDQINKSHRFQLVGLDPITLWDRDTKMVWHLDYATGKGEVVGVAAPQGETIVYLHLDDHPNTTTDSLPI